VQRLVHVGFGHRDVIFETPGQRGPKRMHGAQRRVAVLHRIDDDADGGQIVNRRKVAALLHLRVDRVKVFGPSLNLGVDAELFELVAQTRDGARDRAFAFLARLRDALDDVAIRFRIDVTQAEIFHLPLDLPDTEPVRDRCVDVERLACNRLLFARTEARERAHVVQAVGEFDDDDADVLGHRHEHLA
jgi:hypothetical protein